MPCQTPHLDEASSAEPKISPGVVTDDEWLLRLIFNPDHVQDGQLQPAAIPLADLQKRGFSINRLQYITREFVENAISRAVARSFDGSPRTSEGVACFSARSVRDVRDNGNQGFVVIDTAKTSNLGHASIYLADIEMKPSRARRMRNRLLSLLQERISVSQAFALRVSDR